MTEVPDYMLHSVQRVVELIKTVGIYELGTYDGCPCTDFEVRDVHVHVSCHKSGDHGIRVYSQSADFAGSDHQQLDFALKPIADEVLRQVDNYYDAGGEYAATFPVRYEAWGK